MRRTIVAGALLLLACSVAWGRGARARDPRLDGNLAIVFDASGSMAGAPIREAKKSLEAFLRALPPDWNAGVIVFDKQGTRELLPMGRYSPEEVRRAVEPIGAGGGTPLGQAIGLSRAMLNERRRVQQGYGTYRLLVVTDGEATDSRDMRAASMRTVSDGTEMIVIGFRIKGGHSLREFATDYREAGDQVALSKAMQAALAEANPADEKFTFEDLFR